VTGLSLRPAAGNERSGKEVIVLLLDRRGADVLVTEAVVKTAVGDEGMPDGQIYCSRYRI
jgi:hypothetical protein